MNREQEQDLASPANKANYCCCCWCAVLDLHCPRTFAQDYERSSEAKFAQINFIFNCISISKVQTDWLTTVLKTAELRMNTIVCVGVGVAATVFFARRSAGTVLSIDRKRCWWRHFQKKARVVTVVFTTVVLLTEKAKINESTSFKCNLFFCLFFFKFRWPLTDTKTTVVASPWVISSSCLNWDVGWTCR